MTFILLALACSLAFVWTVVVVPETKGVSLEEIDMLFLSSIGQADVEGRKRVRASTVPLDIARLTKAQVQDEMGLYQVVAEIVDA
jgi:hypothetical protein